ncbi:response regulator [candidate division KSB1 bacterium]|nr:response regulator [candidate division KSB1 bacterium]
MNNRKILVVDNDEKNLRIFQNHFSERNFSVVLARTDHEALDKLFNDSYDVVLSEVAAPGIDGYRILEITQRKYVDRTPHIIFLTQKSDVWHRVKSFKLGAKDYIVKPKHIREIVERVRMVLARLEKRSLDQTVAHKKFVGRLEDLNPTELVQVFGMERKTGILSLYTESGIQGQILFRNGAVIMASTLSLQGEAAVYKMFAWSKGRFSMFFCAIDDADQIGVSNLGLLLQGVKRMETREELLKHLPPLDAVLVTTENFRKIISAQQLERDLDHFISLFDGKRTLERVIDESNYDELTSLRRIQKLYDLGFLKAEPDRDRRGHSVAPALIPEDKEPSIQDRTTKSSPCDQDPDLAEVDSTLAPSTPPQAGELAENELLEWAEEQDPFSIFRATEESSAFTPQEWHKSALIDEEKLADTRNRLEETHPLDELFKIRSEGPAPAEKLTSKIPPSIPKDFSLPKENGTDARHLFRQAHGGVLVFGSNRSVSRQFVDALVDGETCTEKAKREDLSDIYYGTAEFRGKRLLNVIGLYLAKEFTPFIDLFAPRTLGYLILLDGDRLDWTYYRYLVSVLKSKLNRPWQVVVRSNSDREIDLAAVRQKLGISSAVGICRLDEMNTKNARTLLFNLFESYAASKPRGAHV